MNEMELAYEFSTHFNSGLMGLNCIDRRTVPIPRTESRHTKCTKYCTWTYTV